MAIGNLIVILTLAFTGEEPVTKDDAAATQDSARRVLELARQYEFFADRDRQTKFELQPKPLLAYSNPVRGDVHGNVFVWTRNGRPEVVGAFFDFRSENKLDSELHTLRERESSWRSVRDGLLQ